MFITHGQQPRPHLLVFYGEKKGTGDNLVNVESEVLSGGKLPFSRFDHGIHLEK